MPTQEEERGVPYRDMLVPLSGNLSFSSESLVVGIGGIAVLSGEHEYICSADNTFAISSISVILIIPGCHSVTLVMLLVVVFLLPQNLALYNHTVSFVFLLLRAYKVYHKLKDLTCYRSTTSLTSLAVW